MFKPLALLALCTLPLIASQPTISNEVTTAEETAQPLAQSVALIIVELEKGTLMLDNPQLKDPRAMEIIEHLVNVDTIAQGLLVELIALMKIKKLAGAGMTVEQLQQFAQTFNRFHTKFCAFKIEATLKTSPSAS